MKKNRALARLLLPSALGVGGLYLLPFFLTLCQSLTGPGGGLSFGCKTVSVTCLPQFDSWSGSLESGLCT